MKFGLRRELITVGKCELENSTLKVTMNVNALSINGTSSRYTMRVDLMSFSNSVVIGTFDVSVEENIKIAHRHGKALKRFMDHTTGQISKSDLESTFFIDILKRLPEENLSEDFLEQYEKSTDLISAIREKEMDGRREFIKNVLDVRDRESSFTGDRATV